MKTKATKKKTLTIQQLCEKNNAAYEKATKAQRRVMIAKDALQQIKKGQIEPECGTYVMVHGSGNLGYDDALQPLLLNKEEPPNCNCCAKGTLFISCVRLSNRYNGSPNGIGSSGINNIVGWPEDNYDDIERAFEGYLGDVEYGTDYCKGNKWVNAWLEEYPDESERLVAILNNIVANKGTFKPKQILA